LNTYNKKYIIQYLSTIGAFLLSTIFVLVLSINDNFNNFNTLLLFLAIMPECIMTDYVVNKRHLKLIPSILLKVSPITGILLYSLLLFIKTDECLYNSLYGFALILLACPFFLSSIQKNIWKQQLKYALLGFLPVLVSYTYLSMQTDKVNFGVLGTILYLTHCFMLLMALSYSQKDKYFSILVGILYSAGLIFLQRGKTDVVYINADWDWDWNLPFYFEIMLILNYIISLLVITLITYFLERRIRIESKNRKYPN
jgi:hypothetical protein